MSRAEAALRRKCSYPIRSNTLVWSVTDCFSLLVASPSGTTCCVCFLSALYLFCSDQKSLSYESELKKHKYTCLTTWLSLAHSVKVVKCCTNFKHSNFMESDLKYIILYNFIPVPCLNGKLIYDILKRESQNYYKQLFYLTCFLVRIENHNCFFFLSC